MSQVPRVTLGQKYLNLKIFSKWLIKCVQVHLLSTPRAAAAGLSVFICSSDLCLFRDTAFVSLSPPWEAGSPLEQRSATSDKCWVPLETLVLQGWRSGECGSSWGVRGQVGQHWTGLGMSWVAVWPSREESVLCHFHWPWKSALVPSWFHLQWVASPALAVSLETQWRESLV